MPHYTGGCLCGAVRIEIGAAPYRVGMCHCLDCRKRQGAIFHSFAVFPIDAVTVSGETREFRNRYFCPTCGSSLFDRSGDEFELSTWRTTTNATAPPKGAPSPRLARGFEGTLGQRLKSYRLFAVVCLFSACSGALGQVTASAKAEALQAFETLQSAADAQFERCRQAARAVFLQEDANWDCMQIGKAAVSGRYADVKGRVAGDQGIVAALEDYAASALTAFDDLRPQSLEREAGYEARVGAVQSDLRRKANIVRLRMQ